MVELWFGIAAVMLTAYVVLDGFDLGAGALHLFVARTDRERRQVLAAIGPYWDGNEVWLLATGGALFVAFPSGARLGAVGVLLRDLPRAVVLILRGISIEFRSHVEHPLWRAAWDFVLRGGEHSAAGAVRCRARQPRARAAARRRRLVRARALHRFHRAAAGRHPRLVHGARGVFALLAIAGHGGAFLLEDRRPGAGAQPPDRDLSVRRGGCPLAACDAADLIRQRADAGGVAGPAAGVAVAALAVGGLDLVAVGFVRSAMRQAFLGLVRVPDGMLAATAACVFPVMLRSIDPGVQSLTAYNASVPAASLETAFTWWIVGFPLAVLYFVMLFRIHRGKAVAAEGRHGY